MKVLRQSSRYCRGFSRVKKIIFIFMFLMCGLLAYSIYMFPNAFCDKKLLVRQPEKTFSQDDLEKLKEEWLADQRKEAEQLIGDEPPNSNFKAQSIECLINDDRTIQCLQSLSNENDIYVPFSFVGKYFDVTGKVKHYDGYNRFEFSQSYSKNFFKPKQPYSYHGLFMTFDAYNVEYRDRVKCVSGIEGVPLSTQWSEKGYFYAIQIAQFGLSHYCKKLVEKQPKVTLYDDAENGIQSKWKTSNRHCVVKTATDKEVGSNVIQFSVPESVPLGSGAILSLSNTHEYVLSFDIKFITNGSVSIVVDTGGNGKGKQYTIHYVTSDLVMEYDSQSSIFIGIGKSNTWRRISRDIILDLKAIGSMLKSKTKKISRLVLRGEGFIDNITISKSSHSTHIRDASNWLVKNQDPKTGGWKNDISRSFREGFRTLSPGWISAMGQGQAMSLLARAYFSFGTESYIKALSRALKPYTVPSEKGGVRAIFMEKYVWYEEYPTTPSSFVLNGFIFSLIGLYDYKALLEDKFKLNSSSGVPSNVYQNYLKHGVNLKEDYKLASQLFDEGITSLKEMLPLYDGGSRTYYDLRHFMLKMQPNIARWDYHLVHINQLSLLKSILNDPIFERYHKYWFDYTKGKFAPHN